jgi:outer membrane protein assembly factor BamB
VTLASRAVLGLLLLAAAAPALADDWPMLAGHPDRNNVSPEKGLPVTFEAEKQQKNIKWVADLGSATWSTPVIAGGRVFVGTNNDKPRDPAITGDKGVLMCFAESDGKFLWQAVHDKLPNSDKDKATDWFDFTGIGVCSSPCVVGEQLFYVSNRAELICRAVQDGKQVWLLDMIQELGIMPYQGVASAPLVVGDLVFVVTGQGRHYKKGVVVNPKAPSFIAVNRMTGKVVWQDSSPGENLFQGGWGSASYSVVERRAQVAFPGGDGWVYAFDPPSGKLLWRFNCKAHEKLDADGKPETPNQLLAAPVFAGHRVIIATGIDPDTNGPGSLRAIDARKSGDVTASAELWRLSNDDFGTSIATVAVHEGLVYTTECAGFVNCIDLETGKRVWRHDTKSTSWGSPLVADGKVYVRDGDGEVLVLQTGRQEKLLAKNGGLPSVDNGSVVAANGVLYFAGSKKLYAVAERK